MFDIYKFVNDVKNSLPYEEQWNSDSSSKAKLVRSIGDAMSDQNLGQYDQQIQDLVQRVDYLETENKNLKELLEKNAIVIEWPKIGQ